MATKQFPKGLDDRMRDQDGQVRHKRRDTLVGTLRQTYGDDFAKGTRADAQLGTVLDRAGVERLLSTSRRHRSQRIDSVRLARHEKARPIEVVTQSLSGAMRQGAPKATMRIANQVALEFDRRFGVLPTTCSYHSPFASQSCSSE